MSTPSTGDNPADEWVGTVRPCIREDHEADDANEQTNEAYIPSD